MKPKKALLAFLAAFAAVSFPLHAATINLDLTTNNAGAITLDPGSNTFSYTAISVDYLIVGGGGGGGNARNSNTRAGGGGGAGGLLQGTTSISGTQSIVVGTGGAGTPIGAGTRGSNGGNSTAFAQTAVGGGGGGMNASQTGGVGGSGGGGASNTAGGAGTVGQGFDGSAGQTGAGNNYFGGGGGGADGAGGIITGGAGLTLGITGSSLTYAQGGNGGSGNAKVSSTPAAAAANTGNGGLGIAPDPSNAGAGGAGGSGIVVVRYTGDNLLNGGIVSTDGGDTVHQFTTTGTSTMGFIATIAGNIDGDGDLEWNNPNSILTISGNLSHTGSTTTTAGTIILAGANSAATGPMILNGGLTQFESLAAINGTGANVSINSAGTMAFGPSFNNTDIPAALGRVVTTSTGTVAVDNHANFNFDFDTPGLTAAHLGAVEDLSYTGTLTPQGTTYRLGGGGGTLTMANVNALTGAGNSAVIRSSVILPVANNHDGGTTLSADSTLTLGNDGSLGSGTFTIAGASTIQPVGTVVTTNAVAANANFNIGGTGTLTLGTVTVNDNRIITNNNSDGTTTLGAIGVTSGNRNLTFNGGGNTTVSGNITTGTGTLTKNNAGTLTLEGANTYGTTTISGGTLVLSGSNSSAGATTLNAATLQLDSDSNGGLASGLLTISQNAGVLQAVNADRVIANDVSLNSSPTISGTQSLTINGTMTLNNNRTLTNSISGTGKSLTFATVTGTNRSLTLSGDGNTTVTGGVTLGSGTLTKNGVGTLVLQGTNEYTGNTTVASGTLALVGGSQDSAIIVQNGSFLSFTLGSPTTSTKALTLNSGSKIRINGTPAATSYTLITASTIGGTGTPILEDEITGYELQVFGGNELRLVKIGSATPYDTWATGGELFGDDANDDGISNGMAFLLGASGPTISALDKLPTVTETAGGLVLNFTMLNAASRGTAALAIEHSNSLAADSWTTVSVPNTAGETTVGAVTFNVTLDSPLNTVTATISSSAADGGKLFGRLKATE